MVIAPPHLTFGLIAAFALPYAGIARAEELRLPSWGQKKELKARQVFALQNVEASSTDHIADYPTEPRGLAELPPHVQHEAGKLSLYADYDDRLQGRIVVHVINATERDQSLPNQDMDPFLKLFARNDQGDWVRAQSHRYSWCGNSYFQDFQLPSGTFRSILGWIPQAGKLRSVRYQIEGNVGIMSNEGQLPIDDSEIERARFDEMAIQSGDIEFVRALLLEQPPNVEGEELARIRECAVSRLLDLPVEEMRSLLERYWEEGEPSLTEMPYLFGAFERIDPSLAVKQILAALDGANERLRYQVLRFIPFADDPRLPGSSEIWERARSLATDPAAEVPMSLYERLLPEDGGLNMLLDIAGNDRLDPTKRRMAQYAIEARRAAMTKSPIALTIQTPRIDTVEGLPRPGDLRVTITNRSEAPIEFRYRDARDFVGVYLRIESPEHDRLLLPVERNLDG